MNFQFFSNPQGKRKGTIKRMGRKKRMGKRSRVRTKRRKNPSRFSFSKKVVTTLGSGQKIGRRTVKRSKIAFPTGNDLAKLKKAESAVISQVEAYRLAVKRGVKPKISSAAAAKLMKAKTKYASIIARAKARQGEAFKEAAEYKKAGYGVKVRKSKKDRIAFEAPKDPVKAALRSSKKRVKKKKIKKVSGDIIVAKKRKKRKAKKSAPKKIRRKKRKVKASAPKKRRRKKRRVKRAAAPKKVSRKKRRKSRKAKRSVVLAKKGSSVTVSAGRGRKAKKFSIKRQNPIAAGMKQGEKHMKRFVTGLKGGYTNLEIVGLVSGGVASSALKQLAGKIPGASAVIAKIDAIPVLGPAAFPILMGALLHATIGHKNSKVDALAKGLVATGLVVAGSSLSGTVLSKIGLSGLDFGMPTNGIPGLDFGVGAVVARPDFGVGGDSEYSGRISAYVAEDQALGAYVAAGEGL